MQKYIWLVPLLPLAGAAINGLLGRNFRFSERLIGGIAVGSVALAFLISLAAIFSYAYSNHVIWPNPYVTSQDDAFKFTWIPGGAVRITQGSKDRAPAMGPGALANSAEPPAATLLNVEWSYQLDPLSSIFMLIV